MIIYAIVQGTYGARIVKNIRERGPKDWTIEVWNLTFRLPAVIDEPSDFIPKNVPKADLILSLTQDPNTAQLLPTLARKTGAKAVIVAVDDPNWLPMGLQLQTKKELENMGVASVYPRPFCTLTEVGNPLIDAFAKFFGNPELEIKVDKAEIKDVAVRRGAPCGSTWYVADKLKGVKKSNASNEAGLAHHYYPCLASMQMDKHSGETLMHLAGFAIKGAVERAINSSSST